MNDVAATGRLIRSCWVLLRADVLIPREVDPILPPTVRLVARTLRIFAGPTAREGRPGQRLAKAFERLGPATIKLGQVLSTRADIFGREFGARGDAQGRPQGRGQGAAPGRRAPRGQ